MADPINAMDYWRYDDDTELDRRAGTHNLVPALLRTGLFEERGGGRQHDVSRFSGRPVQDVDLAADDV
jgi:hypothetical protein